MAFCPYCGGPVDAGTAYCTYCGSPLSQQQNQAPAPQQNAGYTPNYNNNASYQNANNQYQNVFRTDVGRRADLMPGSLMDNTTNSVRDSMLAGAAHGQSGVKNGDLTEELMEAIFQMFQDAAFEEAGGDQSGSEGPSENNIDYRSTGKQEFSADIFYSTNWKSQWNGMCNGLNRTGIILTDTTGVKNLKGFYTELEAYIEHKKARGIDYALLDIKTQCLSDVDNTDINDVICLLSEIYNVAVPHFLMIVGDSSVIPSAKWRNPVYDPLGEGDCDMYVTSDLAYLTFDTESPWDGMEYYFDNITQVGRVPTCADTDFKEAEIYFRNTRFAMLHDSVKSFACSAKIWERTSKVEFSSVKPYMVTSPDYTSSPAHAKKFNLKLLGQLSPDYNLLCFNLHGSDESNAWYGQSSKFVPEGFNAELLPDTKKSYAMITEACYGAKPKICPDDDDKSILLTALANRCLSFVGSTQIAYGLGDGRLCGADIIADAYLKSIIKGNTFGEAFLDALCAINKNNMNEIDIKTLAEFALYGDPSNALLSKGSAKAFGKHRSVTKAKAEKNESKKIALMSCDGSPALTKGGPSLLSFSSTEKAKIQTMSKCIKDTGKSFIMSNFSAMSSVEPKIFKVVGQSGYRAHYSKKEGNIRSLVNLHLDDNGKIEKVYISK